MRSPLIFLCTMASLAVLTASSGFSQDLVIYERGAKVSRLDIRRDETSQEHIVEIEALNISGGSISLSRRNPVLPPAEISSIISINGTYVLSRDVRKSGRGVLVQLLDVVYPYRARMTISEQILEFELRQPGYWKINVGISQ